MSYTSPEASFRLVDWIESSADVVAAIGRPELHQIVDRSLSGFIRYDDSKQFAFSAGDAPVLVYNSSPGAPAPVAIDKYLGRSYELNPFFRRFRRGQAVGAYRMRDIAERNLSRADVRNYPVALDTREEIGYLTDGYPPRTEELCIGVPMGADRCLAITLSRAKSRKGFSDDELSRAKLVAPFLTSVFQQAMLPQVCETGSVNTRVRPPAGNIDQLTAREKEVIVLLLKGHSSLSISMHLGIALTTVKSHRKNIYAKLQIATLAELFSTVSLERFNV